MCYHGAGIWLDFVLAKSLACAAILDYTGSFGSLVKVTCAEYCED